MSSSGTWDTLFNFNAMPGQSWHYNPSGLNEKVEVQNTGQAMVNGHLLKWYTVKYAKDGAEHPVADTIYERLGSKEGIHPYRTHFIISDPGISGFCNYSDNDFSDWNQTDVACRSMPTSRNDLNNRPQFSVYPNPASEILTLVCEGPAGKAYSVTLHDLMGRQVLEDRITGHSQSFSVATVTNGVYWLSIINERGERFYQKVVVQR